MWDFTTYSKIRYWMQQQPIFPDRRQSSIFGASELNFCVRYENRWDLTANVTAMVYIRLSSGYIFFLVYSYCTLFFNLRQFFYTVDSQLHRYFFLSVPFWSNKIVLVRCSVFNSLIISYSMRSSPRPISIS